MVKRVGFLTGTRADFGKLKPLIRATIENPENFSVEIYVTGMHMNPRYGNTHLEVERSFPKQQITLFSNHSRSDSMDVILANTITGLSGIISGKSLDLLVVHGDRVEALAGAIVGSLNNILVAHIEGGEVSGTIDELIRHAVTKLSHLHFVSNDSAFRNVLQLGEPAERIFKIGSPEVDMLRSGDIPPLKDALHHYGIPFHDYAILIYHPVTTDLETVRGEVSELTELVRHTPVNFIVVGPNNDTGADIVMNALSGLAGLENVVFFPSIRFEYFLSLLANARFIIGNSSSGVREAPSVGVPCINIGSRQHARATGPLIFNVTEVNKDNLRKAISEAEKAEREPDRSFGEGVSSHTWIKVLKDKKIWLTSPQKYFISHSGEGSG